MGHEANTHLKNSCEVREYPSERWDDEETAIHRIPDQSSRRKMGARGQRVF